MCSKNTIASVVYGRRVSSYTVVQDSQSVVLRLSTIVGNGPTKDLVFKGVIAHHFSHYTQDSVLLSVEECPVARIMREFAEVFEQGISYGWPGGWNTSMEACRERLDGYRCRSWLIIAKTGLRGFVIGYTVQIV